MRLRIGFLTCVALASVSMSAFCAGRAMAQAPETPKIRVSTLPIAGQVPIYTAQKLGYFKDAGLDVDITFADGGAQSVPLLVQGSLQLAVTPITSAALANQQGFNLKLVPPTLDDKKKAPGQTVLLVRDDGGVGSIPDLKGKRVAVNTINSVNWLYARALLRKGGLDPNAVTFVELPFPSMNDALLRGSVDGIIQVQPFHHIGVSSGKMKAIGYPFADVQPGIHIASYAGDGAWIKANPKTVKAFTDAMARAIDYLGKNPDQAKTLIAEFTKAKPELVQQIPIDDWSTRISVDDLAKQLELMRQEGVLKKPIEAGSLVDAR
jgi:NitT/TauT family transport system substrate-binding protein